MIVGRPVLTRVVMAAALCISPDAGRAMRAAIAKQLF